MQKAQMSLSKCINAAEMGLSIRETSTLLDIPYRQVLALSREYGIKFACGKRKANEQRRKDSLRKSQASAENHGVVSGQQATIQPKARTRRDKSTDRNSAEIIEEIYTSKLPRAEKYERLYAEAWRSFEQHLIDLKMRPPFPELKVKLDIENASNAAIRKQRERSVARRQMIMACFNKKQTKVAEDINRETKLGLRITSQMLDLMYRDGVLTRERVQVGPNKRNSVYHYSRK
jgi:hypothetical protein